MFKLYVACTKARNLDINAPYTEEADDYYEDEDGEYEEDEEDSSGDETVVLENSESEDEEVRVRIIPHPIACEAHILVNDREQSAICTFEAIRLPFALRHQICLIDTTAILHTQSRVYFDQLGFGQVKGILAYKGRYTYTIFCFYNKGVRVAGAWVPAHLLRLGWISWFKSWAAVLSNPLFYISTVYRSSPAILRREDF